MSHTDITAKPLSLLTDTGAPFLLSQLSLESTWRCLNCVPRHFGALWNSASLQRPDSHTDWWVRVLCLFKYFECHLCLQSLLKRKAKTTPEWVCPIFDCLSNSSQTYSCCVSSACLLVVPRRDKYASASICCPPDTRHGPRRLSAQASASQRGEKTLSLSRWFSISANHCHGFLSSTSSWLAVLLLSLSQLNLSSRRTRICLICFTLLLCFLQLCLTHIKSLGYIYFLRDEPVTLFPYLNNINTVTSQLCCKESLK